MTTTDAELERLIDALLEIDRLCEPEQAQVLHEFRKRMAAEEYAALLARLKA